MLDLVTELVRVGDTVVVTDWLGVTEGVIVGVRLGLTLGLLDVDGLLVAFRLALSNGELEREAEGDSVWEGEALKEMVGEGVSLGYAPQV